MGAIIRVFCSGCIDAAERGFNVAEKCLRIVGYEGFSNTVHELEVGAAGLGAVVGIVSGIGSTALAGDNKPRGPWFDLGCAGYGAATAVFAANHFAARFHLPAFGVLCAPLVHSAAKRVWRSQQD